MEYKVEKDQLFVKEDGKDWIPMPDSIMRRMLSAANTAGLSGRLPKPAPPAAPELSPEEKAKAHNLAVFREHTGTDPVSWLERYDNRKIAERSPTTEGLYLAACEITGRTPDPADLA